MSECPTIQCRYCHKISYIVYNCPTKPPKPSQSGILPRPVNHSVAVATVEKSPSDPSLLSVLVSKLGPLIFTIVKQFLSTSYKVSSVVSGNTWYFDFPIVIIYLPILSYFLLLFLLLMLLLLKLLMARTLLPVILVLFPPLHCLYLTHILFLTSLLISSLLVNYVNLVLTCGLVLLVVVRRILRRIRFLGQAVE